MPRYNDRFQIDLEEMDLIEDALRDRVKALSVSQDATSNIDTARKLRSIKSLLGRLHNQKVFYRPKRGYIGG